MPRKQKSTSNRPKKPIKKQKQKVKAVTVQLSKCEVSAEPIFTRVGPTILSDEIDHNLLRKWPKLKLKVPPIFLHNLCHLEQHVKKILSLGIKFYQPQRGKNYIRLTCESFKDHKYMLQYLDKKEIPYHTFSLPSKRKMKVVVRGLPYHTDVKMIKEELESLSIPVIRAHKMRTQDLRKESNILLLIVIPNDDKGKVILKVTQLLGYKVTLEPPNKKPRQCYRCQKWGHSQRYCHGIIKCVKCSGDHWTKKCLKTPKQEPKCANCGDAHTASYRKCIFASGFDQYQLKREQKTDAASHKPRELVTLKNFETLYKNVDYSK